MPVSKLSEADYVIRKMALPMPEGTVLVGDDGQFVKLGRLDDNLWVKFLDLRDGWRWECRLPFPCEARKFCDNWRFVVDQWWRMMAEKEAP